ncbi:MAG: hypothetical protein MI864_20440 [Pseudomonadales bacterium]|uniref:Uncharacterized protein n=1 Tax=Oleiphilus messinensis TaxID=141451 RepID=A0A1Y0IH80_9GAMM|nr:hypothetical protein [Oleiphilus messinensis]ARU59206.1 hypothetical protein OLMES_5222 [Oleiphilus messinensis]MCG8612887.1 hypothetical protein [Pseudomonadales bacterium]
MDIAKELEEAKKRLEKARLAIQQRDHAADIESNEEPEHLISGEFDEVELKRIDKEEKTNG